MASSKIIEKIRQWSVEGDINYKKHAFTRMVERKITTTEVEEALQHSEIIQRYPDDKPLGSILLLGYTGKKRPLHIVVALDEHDNYIWVITVYQPDGDKWNKNFTKRR